MTYKATLGRTGTVITVFVTLLLGSMLAYCIYRMAIATAVPVFMIFAFIAIAISSLYVLTYLYRPTGYIVDSKHLVVTRPFNDVEIPIEEIKDVYIVRKESMTWTERIGGNGGVFGFYGNFRNHFGTMTWYATKLNNYVMIETARHGKIIVTPDNTDMAKALRELIGARTIPNAHP